MIFLMPSTEPFLQRISISFHPNHFQLFLPNEGYQHLEVTTDEELTRHDGDF